MPATPASRASDPTPHSRTARGWMGLITRLQPGWAVWGVWLAMSVALGVLVWMYRSPHPFADEWVMVPLMVPGEPLTWQTLWDPVNEHRMPAVKLPLALLGRWNTGDFRPAAYAMAALASAFTAAMLLAVRSLRGRYDWSDLAWPLFLLHFGHFELYINTVALNLFGGACLALLALALLLNPQGLSGRRLIALSLLLAAGPLFGASGLVPCGALALWLAATGVAHWRPGDRAAQRQAVAWLAAAAPALCVSCWYFVDFEVQNPTSPAGFWPTLRTLLQMLTISSFPRAQDLWPYAGPLVLAAGVAALLALAWRWRQCPADRVRTSAALCFVAAFGLLVVAMAVGRAQFGPEAGCAGRHAWTLVPIPLGLYLIAIALPVRAGAVEQSERSAARVCVWLPAALCCLAALCLPWRLHDGRQATKYHHLAFTQFDRDLADGCPREVLEMHSYVGEKMPGYLTLMAERIRSPRYAAFGRPAPEFIARRVELRLTSSHDAQPSASGEWWASTGPDPYLEFDLPAITRVLAVRVALRVELPEDATGSTVVTQLFWSRGTEEPYVAHERNRCASFAASPAIETHTLWVNGDVARLRIDPHCGPCRFTLASVELLEPVAGPVAQTPVERR